MKPREAVLAGHSWQLIGGHRALDLANTVSWRLDPARSVDRLTDFDRLIDWFRVASPGESIPELGPTVEDTAAQLEALASVRALRDALIQLLDRHLAGEQLRRRDISPVELAWRHSVDRATLSSVLPTRWQIRIVSPADVVDQLALCVGDLLAHADLSRLRRCDGHGCGWLFLDTSRNRSRRWCDPNDCGNRTRVQNYAARHRQPPMA